MKAATTPKATKAKVANRAQTPAQPEQLPSTSVHPKNKDGNDFGLTVRVEINLPADGTKETYDNIFKSIKENLLGG
jgi:hypothetical protein